MKSLNAYQKRINMNTFSVRVIWHHANTSTKMNSLRKTEKSDECLNIFALNIRSLPKHGGELLYFLKDLDTKFDVTVLTEIGSKNISVVEKLLPDYNFHYVLPAKNKCGGVGIYTCNSLTNVIVKDDIKLAISCDCIKCEIESLFIEFCYRGTTLLLAESTETRTGMYHTLYPILKQC